MKLRTHLLAAALAFGLAVPAFAADKPEKPAGDKPAAAAAADKPAKGDKKAKGVRGKVVKVDGDKLVLSSGKKGEEKEVAVTTGASTKVVIDGKEAKLADLKAGQVVMVSPAEGTAETITVAAAKPKKEKAADAK